METEDLLRDRSLFMEGGGKKMVGGGGVKGILE